MTSLARLVTFVDIDDASVASGLAFSARHDAVLSDGRRIVLIADRGWSQSTLIFGSDEPHIRDSPSSPWTFVTPEQIEESARSVVGPDEPYRNYTRAEMEA